MKYVSPEKHHPEEQCIFWDGHEKNCLSTVGGLFLPVAEHIATYCLTSHHLVCSHYPGNAARNKEGVDEGKSNRRQHDRVLGRYPFRIVELVEGQEVARPIKANACTVDYSLGGVRFESHQALPVNALVRFSLNGYYSNKILSGSGMVKWCKPLESSPMFHAGIAFVEKSVAEKLGAGLGLIREQ
jgi:PilZ domain